MYTSDPRTPEDERLQVCVQQTISSVASQLGYTETQPRENNNKTKQVI